MNVFLAAVYTNQYCQDQKQWPHFNDHERGLVNAIPHILESYHYVGAQRYVDDMRRNGAQIFLDSGAFSAKNLGVDIDVNAYCDYIIRNKDIIRVEDGVLMASVLDGIGDPQKTYENQLHMEKCGARPMPCFHYGEDERYLEWYLKHYDYITFGGMVSAKTDNLIKWLDRIWSKYLLDGSGRPRVKTHAFGVTTIKLMERYPWHSVDSSSWIQAASFGSVYTPQWGPISISEKSPSRHDAGKHITTFTEVEQQLVKELLASQGFDWQRLSTVYQSRAAYNLWAYCELNKMIDARGNRDHIALHVQELF